MAKAYNPETVNAIAAVFRLPSFEARIVAACAIAAPKAHPDIREHFHQWSNDKRKALSRSDCMYEGNLGETTQVSKEQSGALRSFLDGKKRLISTTSFYEHLITRLILANPVGAAPPRATATSTRFTRREGIQERSA
jgi:hypothetical protein